jgi:hypothetical protein
MPPAVAALFMDHAAAAAAYAGPGDLVSTGWACWSGLRAFTLASIGANAIDLRRDGGSPATQTFTTVAGGGLDIAGITTFKGANNLFVSKLWDQTGNGNHFVQTTAALQPQFLLGVTGSRPGMFFVSASGLWLPLVGTGSLNTTTVSSPFTMSAVGERTSNFANYNLLFIDNSSNAQVRWEATANTIGMYAGAPFLDVTAAGIDSAFHGFNCSFNGASSNLQIDATSNLGTTGTAQPITISLGIGGNASGLYLDGYVMEVGVNSAAFSTTVCGQLGSQQKSFYGY